MIRTDRECREILRGYLKRYVAIGILGITVGLAGLAYGVHALTNGTFGFYSTIVIPIAGAQLAATSLVYLWVFNSIDKLVTRSDE